MKNILLAGNLDGLDPMIGSALEGLYHKGWNFFAWNSGKNNGGSLLKRLSTGGKNFFLGPGIDSRKSAFLFFLFLPILRFFTLLRFFFLNRNRPIQTIIAGGQREKLILAPLNRWFKVRLLFLAFPGEKPLRKNGLTKKAYLKACRRAKIIFFSPRDQENLLRMGVAKENIRPLNPGIKIANREQTDLFRELAGGGDFHRKFFTIGTIADLNDKQKMEILFQAVNTCVSAIPNLQLIVVGDGKEKKNLSWVAKKLKIDTRVWMISGSPVSASDGKNFSPALLSGGQPGEEENQSGAVKKWLKSFEIFVSVSDEPRLFDFSNILKAMAARIPVIAPAGAGFENIIIQNKTGSLLEMDLSEMLARQIIRLSKNRNLRVQLGENAARHVDKSFTGDIMVENLEKILMEDN
ncbi:MAG: glycosyltransferase family 4 protein [Patescibacteria group bacterium]|jgi:glycosyltransferase involved in cell wall biosynthesis